MLNYRAAEFGRDWARLYAWRNDPGTVAGFFSGEAVALGDHLQWMHRTLAAADVRIFVTEDAQRSRTVGTFRLTLKPDHVDCSLIVDPRYRREGYGALTVARIVDAALSLATSDARWRLGLRARVKYFNYASLAAFASAGFVPVELAPDWVVLALSVLP